MSGFESSSFKKNIPSQSPGSSTQHQLREFTVGPPPEDFPGPQNHPNFQPQLQQMEKISVGEYEKTIQRAREEKFANISKISPQAKKRLELLANIGRLEKNVEVGGFTFSIRTLKAKEAKESALTTFASSTTQLEASFEVRKQQLARSIFKIDGEDIAVVLGSDSIDARLEFIEEYLEDILITKLYDEFLLLKKEAQNKYGIKSDDDVKEVAEDLKK